MIQLNIFGVSPKVELLKGEIGAYNRWLTEIQYALNESGWNNYELTEWAMRNGFDNIIENPKEAIKKRIEELQKEREKLKEELKTNEVKKW